jgi:YggT family protein
MFILGNLIIGITTVLDSFLFIFTIIILASAVISWVNADPHNQIVRIIRGLTEPLYRKIRKKIKTNYGQMDLTPIILILVIMFIQAGILPSLHQIGRQLAQGTL